MGPDQTHVAHPPGNVLQLFNGDYGRVIQWAQRTAREAVAALQPPVATLARTVAADCEEFRAEIKDARAQLAEGIELISREVARTLASVHADHKALRARAAAHEEQVRRQEERTVEFMDEVRSALAKFSADHLNALEALSRRGADEQSVRRWRNVRRIDFRSPKGRRRCRGLCEGHHGRPRRRRAVHVARAAPGAAVRALFQSNTARRRPGGAAAAYLVNFVNT